MWPVGRYLLLTPLARELSMGLNGSAVALLWLVRIERSSVIGYHRATPSHWLKWAALIGQRPLPNSRSSNFREARGGPTRDRTISGNTTSAPHKSQKLISSTPNFNLKALSSTLYQIFTHYVTQNRSKVENDSFLLHQLFLTSRGVRNFHKKWYFI